MASSKAHIGASVVLLVVTYVIGFLAGFMLSWTDVMRIMVFGVLIDADHIPFGRLYAAFKASGIQGMLASWKRDSWFDADHLNVLHTSWALLAVIIFSYIVNNVWPFVAYAVHMMIDSGSMSQFVYPKCSPLPKHIYRYLGRFYPAWAKYYTEGVPSKEDR